MRVLSYSIYIGTAGYGLFFGLVISINGRGCLPRAKRNTWGQCFTNRMATQADGTDFDQSR